MTKYILCLATFAFHLQAAESILTDSEGQKAYVYTPTEQPTEGKTYWLAVGVHGVGGDGKGANGIASWTGEDVLVLGPSFVNTNGNMLTESYQMCGPAHEAKLKALVAEVGKTWKLHPKVFLHGFSAGAQFVHRFAMKNPELVAGVSAASAGSWSTQGFGEINPAANHISFGISCGQYDTDKSTPGSPLNRLDWMREFAVELRKAHFDVEDRVIPNTGHKAIPATMALAEACFQRVRILNFSPTVMLACDFNTTNPLWSFHSETTGRATTAQAAWEPNAGVIEKQGTAERTGALRYRVTSAAKTEAWSGTLATGRLPVSNPEKDINKLTLAFDLSASSARPVRVLIESYNAMGECKGGREGLIYPAAPDDFQRHVLDIGSMKVTTKGDFNTADPWLQISLTVSDALGWPSDASHQIRWDNLSYAAPALYVSPTGKDASGRGSADKPLATLNRALGEAQAGDIILLMDGVFVRKNAVEFPRGGSPAAWITLKNHPGQKPVLTCPDWNILKIGKGSAGKVSDDPALSYIELRGLTVRGVAEEVEAKYKEDVGKPKGSSNGNGISIDGRYQNNKPHHFRIADNEVLQCPGLGISVIHADYVQVENNISHNNCHWMIYAGSGISIYQPFNFDLKSGGHKILISQNITHHNFCTQPWIVTGKPSDGNGIIIDDAQNHQNKSTNGVYHGGFLVQNNLSYENGGSGMHSYASDHIDFINNTSANNCTVNDYGQLSVTACGHVRVLNNILVAAKNKPLNRVNGEFHDVLLSHNLFFGGNNEIVPGENGILTDPLFKEAAKGDFHLDEKSPARNAGGAWEISPVIDLLGKVRDPGVLDLGALGN